MTLPPRRPLIYVAGPLSGARMRNTVTAVQIGDLATSLGAVPIIPHLTHFWEALSKAGREYEDWMAIDFQHLLRCDALIRIWGDSRGADREVSQAKNMGIPVFFLPPAVVDRDLGPLKNWIEEFAQ